MLLITLFILHSYCCKLWHFCCFEPVHLFWLINSNFGSDLFSKRCLLCKDCATHFTLGFKKIITIVVVYDFPRC